MPLASWVCRVPIKQYQGVELLGTGKGHLYTLEAARCLRARPQTSGLPSCLLHLPPTLVPDPRVTGLLGLVSTAEEGTEEDEKMQAEKDGGKGKSGPLVCMGDQAVEQ